MPIVGVAEILIRPTFTDGQKEIAKEYEEVAKKSGTNIGEKIGSFAKKSLTVLGVSAGGLLSASLAKGFGRLSSIETAKAKLLGLKMPAQEVEAVMKNALAAVNGTAFGLDEAATVAASAVAAGVKPGKDLERTLKLTADAATIAGVGMGDMGAIFNKVAASNKIQGDVIAQLNDAGIPIIQLLGKEIGATAEETVALASKGKINFATFQNAMEKGLGGAALKSGDTFQGALKNTWAAIGRIGANLLVGVFPLLRDFFGFLIVQLKAVEPVAKTIGLWLGERLKDAVTWMVAMGPTMAVIGRAIGSTFVVMVDVLKNVVTWIRENWGWLKILAAGLVASTAVVLIYKAAVLGVSGAKNLWAGATKKVTGAIEFLNKAMKGNVFVLILTLVAGLVAAFITWINTTKEGQDFWRSFTEFVGKAMDWLWNTILKPAFDWLAKVFTEVLPAAFESVRGGIQGFVDVMVSVFRDIIPGAIGWFYENAIRRPFEAVATFFTKTIPDAARWLWENGIKPPLDAITSAFQWLNTYIILPLVTAFRIGFDAMGAAATWLWQNALKPFVDFMWSFIQILTLPYQIAWKLLEVLFTRLIPAALDWTARSFRILGDFVGNIFTKVIPDALNWFYGTVLKPVFDAIGAVFVWLYQNIVQPFVDSLVRVFRFLGDMVVWLYSSVFLPVWNAIGAVVKWVSEKVIAPVLNGVIWLVQVAIPTALRWLYTTVILPVWNAIGAAFRVVYLSVIKPVYDALVTFFTVIIPNAIRWFKAGVVDPVWNAIAGVFRFVWENIIRAAFNNMVSFFTVTIPNAIRWLKDTIITPIWNAIAAVFTTVWNNSIKPAFDLLVNFVMKTIPDAFRNAVNGVKTVWDKLIEIAKMPVRFVVETVIRDGLVRPFNGFLKGLGIAGIAEPSLPRGFYAGGWTGPGGKMDPAGVVHADEYVIRKESQNSLRSKFPGLLDKINAYGASALYGLAGYFTGGLVNPLKGGLQLTQGYNRIHKGIDLAAAVGTPVYAANSGRVSWAGPGVSAPGVWGGNEIHILGNGLETWYAHLSSIGVRLGQMVNSGQLIGLSGNTGISSGPHLHFGAFSGGWPNDLNPLSLLSGAAPSGEGGSATGGGGGFNPVTALLGGLLDQIKKQFPDGGKFIDMAVGFVTTAVGKLGDWIGKKLGEAVDLIGSVGKNVGDFINDTGKNVGKFFGGNATGPTSTLYDTGGVLPPGLSQVMNLTGKPEAILTARQWDMVSRAVAQPGRSGTDVIIRGNVYGDPDHIAKAIDKEKRLADLLVTASTYVGS